MKRNACGVAGILNMSENYSREIVAMNQETFDNLTVEVSKANTLLQNKQIKTKIYYVRFNKLCKHFEYLFLMHSSLRQCLSIKFPTTSDINRHGQLQKKATSLKFRF